MMRKKNLDTQKKSRFFCVLQILQLNPFQSFAIFACLRFSLLWTSLF